MSNLVHRIRLREPWRREIRPGEILLCRRFGKPSNLKPSQKVWLVFPEDVDLRQVKLNSLVLETGIRRWEISANLIERNEIEVELLESNDLDQVTAGVGLEIVD